MADELRLVFVFADNHPQCERAGRALARWFRRFGWGRVEPVMVSAATLRVFGSDCVPSMSLGEIYLTGAEAIEAFVQKQLEEAP